MAGPMVILNRARASRLLDAHDQEPPGLTFFCSWENLAGAIRAWGAVKPSEEVTALVIEDDGISVRLRSR